MTSNILRTVMLYRATVLRVLSLTVRLENSERKRESHESGGGVWSGGSDLWQAAHRQSGHARGSQGRGRQVQSSLGGRGEGTWVCISESRNYVDRLKRDKNRIIGLHYPIKTGQFSRTWQNIFVGATASDPSGSSCYHKWLLRISLCLEFTYRNSSLVSDPNLSHLFDLCTHQVSSPLKDTTHLNTQTVKFTKEILPKV